MTFYWWSHWFWITILSNVLLPLIVVVHTYPSQESLQEYNQNQDGIPKNLITKIYQSTTVLSWTTEEATPIFTKSTTAKGKNIEQIHQVIFDSESTVPLTTNNEEEEEYYYDEEDTTDNMNQKINLEQVEAELERNEENVIALRKDLSENDNIKRSAEATLDSKPEIKSTESSTPRLPPQVIEANNYTNFTHKTLANSTNTITASMLNNTDDTNTTTTTTNNASNSDNSTQKATNTTTDTPIANGSTTTILPQAPETPKIVKAQAAGSLDWLNTVAAHLPLTHVATNDDGTHDYTEDQHKIPFTLENANKPEDLRRDESEHRTRKSKGLSAEYKVNRYINYSSDSKNLLTRSAATTVNEYESEESNISSEALSVQRAYFMDVGAISAICFTVFGICCTVGTVGIVLYRRRFLNKPQALSEPDSSVYIDDSTMRVSDNSDEMYSLDNDSFLNSLEAMTIQNYWTDTVKHTKL